jgi:hypothetical protein
MRAGRITRPYPGFEVALIGTLRSERLQFATSINVRYKATACGLFSVLAIAGQQKKAFGIPIKFSRQ